MEHNDALKRVLAALSNRNAGRALTEMANFLAVWPNSSQQAELDSLRNEYELMARYWRQGFKEPQLQALYDGMLHRIYSLYANTSLWRRLGGSPFMSTIYSNLMLQTREWSVANVRQELESYVSDIAMVEFEPANKQAVRRDELNTRHYERMSSLFDYIWTSRTWTDAMATAFEDMLLSPTIDANDQQLIVSALTLSIINMFDMAKFRLLVHVYQQSSVESVRQRALVGWVMGRCFTLSRIFPEEKRLVDDMLEDLKTRQELTELQIQMIYCINTESDNEKIHSEIMPELIRNNHLQITRDGIEEMEGDPLEDILHPEAEDERMEKMEESFRKMLDMHKQGSDIYYSGFSQMKRFPFFQRISNWFLPFSFDHPEVKKSIDGLKYEAFLKRLLMSGSFCSSDKYSFVFAYQKVFERLPQSMLDLMAHDEVSMDELIVEPKNSEPAFIRRTYLQDMYRFFRLFPHAGQFDHPFLKDRELGHVLFFASPLFQNTPLENHFNKVAALLIRQKQYDEALRLLQRYSDTSKNYQYYMMMVSALQHSYTVQTDILSEVRQCYEQALQQKPDDERALQGYARTLFSQNKYTEAAEIYNRLMLINPEKKSLELNKMVCLTKLGQYEEALNTLYRLNYEAPEDDNTIRVLAWTLTGVGKYEQALLLYDKLVAKEPVTADDLLNQGYCLWFAGNIDAAINSFRRYLSESEESVESIIANERELIVEKGITEPEMMMMADSISF